MAKRTVISLLSSITTTSTCLLLLSAKVYWLAGTNLDPVLSQLMTNSCGMLLSFITEAIIGGGGGGGGGGR